ncbi:MULTISPECIES: ammonium transporter [unclassified Synechocystis]|uniref:ammonium transporter n=1 Tax=unclassified Synechocystis TaxID=2640012 RepID=UPI0003FCF091|nr:MULTISPECIES: ammonium transporter [unclassified Synechocystis]AIE73704.1 Ammonium transporter [Synechocystis sp. PCC 6714]MCT0252265.1 ammonium transporter [Synechocystis sp. CS-94]
MKPKIFPLARYALGAILAFLFVGVAQAQTETISVTELTYAINNLFLLAATVLVLFMQAGFAMLEAGLSSHKNTVNVLFKNTFDVCVGVLLYFLFGYSLMYGETPVLGGFFGWSGFGITNAPNNIEGLSPQADWLFQAAFAATAATIVSGAVMGRMYFKAYLIYSAVITGLVYPISGHWKWGGGWLDQLGFHDFAGSILVHAVGGFASLAAVVVMGPRIGRFEGKKVNSLGYQGITFSSLGVFILWVGWYGFNPGSQLAFVGAVNTNTTMLIAVNTTLSAAAGGLAALAFDWITESKRKPNLLVTLNGILGGLVGITASCDTVNNWSAIAIGVVAGILSVLGTKLLDRLRIDDGVGAWPVHGLCGIWGGIAVGIFSNNIEHKLSAQIVGSVVVPFWAFITMFFLFYVLDLWGMLRVKPSQEKVGLDIVEHGQTEKGVEIAFED